MKNSGWIMPVIVISQFCCTSLWFASNGIAVDLIKYFQLESDAVGHLTSAVQFGFIIGTLVFAIFTIADWFSPSKVFFTCAFIGAIFNLGPLIPDNTLSSLMVFRFLTGFFLAGIYPVGMKIAADYYEKGLGLTLGYLVGALTIGTAFPHLIKGSTGQLSWQIILVVISIIAVFGGLLMLSMVPNGPYRKASQQPSFGAWIQVFKNQEFRAAAFGYFGHMWELYTFWAFVPLILSSYANAQTDGNMNIPLLSFLIIASGGLACVSGGYIAQLLGTKKTAFVALSLSCLCCLLSPIFFSVDATAILVIFLTFWAMVVIMDSPLFSTLVAKNAEAETKGTALTIVNCIGFSITIISLQIMNLLSHNFNFKYIFLALSVGPVFGLYALMKKPTEAKKA